MKAKVHIEKDTILRFGKTRNITYVLCAAVNEKLQKLWVNIIKPVTSSNWATSIVTVVKPNGEIYLCGDFKVTVNKFLKVEKNLLPKTDDILAILEKHLQFSKTDLNQVHLKLWVDENSKELLRINTAKGLSHSLVTYGSYTFSCLLAKVDKILSKNGCYNFHWWYWSYWENLWNSF